MRQFDSLDDERSHYAYKAFIFVLFVVLLTLISSFLVFYLMFQENPVEVILSEFEQKN